MSWHYQMIVDGRHLQDCLGDKPGNEILMPQGGACKGIILTPNCISDMVGQPHAVMTGLTCCGPMLQHMYLHGSIKCQMSKTHVELIPQDF